jgi:hypothetical protein
MRHVHVFSRVKHPFYYDDLSYNKSQHQENAEVMYNTISPSSSSKTGVLVVLLASYCWLHCRDHTTKTNERILVSSSYYMLLITV